MLCLQKLINLVYWLKSADKGRRLRRPENQEYYEFYIATYVKTAAERMPMGQFPKAVLEHKAISPAEDGDRDGNTFFEMGKGS